MDHLQSNPNARPWWADVAHLRDDAPATPTDRAVRSLAAPQSDARERSARTRAAAVAGRAPAPRRPHRADRDHGRTTDWFETEARHDGRRVKKAKPSFDTPRPERPRATLIDVAPEHQMLRRAQQVRRAPGERPTVTITGRPDAALPPQVREVKEIRGRRTREGAASLVASPDRLILWAVALGLLMILASIGTASADAAILLP